MVKLYGIRPIKLLIVKNENKKNINGKYCKCAGPIFFSTNDLEKRNTSSKIDCHLVGIIRLFTLTN